MKDSVQGYEELCWIIEQSEDGLYVATATPRMQREIASHYSDADVCVYDYSTDVKPFTFSVPARLFRDNPGKRAYFLLNVQLSLLNENGQFDDALLERLNFCRDMFAREKKNIVFFMTEEAARQLNLKAYDLHSYIRLFLAFEDDSPDEAETVKLPETPPDRSVGVEPPEIDYDKPRNALLAQAIALNNRADQYFDDGRYRDAETLARAALDIRTRLLGADSPDTAAAHYMLGMAEERLGRYDEAMDSLQTALAIQKRTLGERHPDTADTYDRIATVYQDMGDYGRALEYFQKALEIDKAILGAEHPGTAARYNNLGLVYSDMGDLTKALEAHQKALAIDEKTLGAEHPYIATSYNNLGLVYSDMGDLTKALEAHQKALAIREKVLGAEHPDTATDYNNLGLVYQDLGDNGKAQEYLQKALAIREKTLGKDHPYTKLTRDCLAQLRYKIDHPTLIQRINNFINRRNPT